MNNFKESLLMHELYLVTRDSLNSEASKKAVIRQEYKYEYEKKILLEKAKFTKQKELESLKHQRNILFILGWFVIFIALSFVYLYFKKLKRKLETKELLQELKFLKTQNLLQIRRIVSDGITNKEKLNKKIIESKIDFQLNITDWNILNSLYNYPEISNVDIASEISLSVHGVRSSLKKMYNLFDINQSVRDQRILLVIEATRLSSNK